MRKFSQWVSIFIITIFSGSGEHHRVQSPSHEPNWGRSSGQGSIYHLASPTPIRPVGQSHILGLQGLEPSQSSCLKTLGYPSFHCIIILLTSIDNSRKNGEDHDIFLGLLCRKNLLFWTFSTLYLLTVNLVCILQSPGKLQKLLTPESLPQSLICLV